MIPPQLALFVAKYGKQLAVGLFVLVVVSCVYFAIKMHERTVSKLSESEAARASQVVANAVTVASLENQKKAAAIWQASAEKYKSDLAEQESVRAEAREYGDKLNAIFKEHDLAKLAAEKPILLQRAVNRGTANVIRLLNCSSTPRGCPGDRGAAGSDALSPLPSASGSGDVRVDGSGPRKRGRGVLLSESRGVRSS